MADATAVENEQVGNADPLLLRYNFHQILLYLLGVTLFGQTQALGQPFDVGIDCNAFGNAVYFTQHDVGRFASHAFELEQAIHVIRYLAAMLADDDMARFLDKFCLLAKEARRPDHFFQFGAIGGRQVGHRWVAGKEIGRDLVHALVGTLGGQNSSHQQLDRRLVIKFAVRVGICLAQPADDFGDVSGCW